MQNADLVGEFGAGRRIILHRSTIELFSLAFVFHASPDQ